MALQLATDLIADSIGRVLGSALRPWDGHFRNVTFYGTITGLVVAANSLTTATQIVSTLPTGTAPLLIASTTKVANLNADLLDGLDWTAPGAIGGTTPGSAVFTTLNATGACSFTGALTIGGDVVISRSAANVLQLATGDSFIPQTAGQALGTMANPWDVGARTVRHKGAAGVAVSGAGEGAIYFDSATNKYRISENAGSFANLRAASVEIIDTTEVAVNVSTTADQHLKTYTINVGDMNYVGACIYVYAAGEYNTSGTPPNLVAKLTIAGVTTLSLLNGLTLEASVTGADWEMECRITRTATGVTGTTRNIGRFTIDKIALGAAMIDVDTSNSTWDDSVVQTLRHSIAFSAASVTNLWRIRHWEIRRLA